MRFLLLCCAGLLPLVAQEPAKPAEPATNQEAQKPEEKKAEETKSEAAAATASDRTVTGSIDVGYRWVSDVGGNMDAYRTAVNLGEGPKVFNFDFSILNPSGKWYDKIRLFGNNWGGEPNSASRLDMSKQRVYDLSIDYRNIAYYNFLPSFANPAIDRGVYGTQFGHDIRRRLLDTELRFRPGTRITPYVAFTRNWGDGRGVANFVGGGNEYPVFRGMYDKTDQFRAGVNLEFRKFHITLEQGGTTFKDDQTLSTGDRNSGNRTTPFLGQSLYLTNLLQSYRVRGDSIFERALVTFTPFSWVDFSGSFLYSRPRTDTLYNQTSRGNFADLATASIFTSATEFAAANANQPHTTGNINLEIRPMRRVRILESFVTDRYHTASFAAVTQMTIITPQNIPTLSSDRLVVNYNRQQIQANIEVNKWLTLRGGHRYVWGDAETRSPVFLPAGPQRGELEQNVGLFGGQVRMGQKFWLNADSEIATADRVYFRTSLADYRKGTLRGRYQVANSFSLTGNFVALTNESPNPTVKFDMKSYLASLGFLWNPGGGKRITVIGDYTHSDMKSDATYFEPQSLIPALSQYRERAHIGTALIDVNSFGLAKHSPTLSVGGSFYTSGGSRPTSYYTPLVKLGVPVHEHASFFAEWRNYQLSETMYSFEGFRANTFTVGLRLVR